MTTKYGKEALVTPRQRYHLLAEAAARLGARIRLERFKADEDLRPPRGGLVRLKGETVIILDRSHPLEARIDELARALAGLVDDSVYLPPAVRRWVEAAGEEE